jgi:hypothetical protein
MRAYSVNRAVSASNHRDRLSTKRDYRSQGQTYQPQQPRAGLRYSGDILCDQEARTYEILALKHLSGIRKLSGRTKDATYAVRKACKKVVACSIWFGKG